MARQEMVTLVERLLREANLQDQVQSVERQVALMNVKWLTQYLCHFSAEMAEFFPAKFFQDVCNFSSLSLIFSEL